MGDRYTPKKDKFTCMYFGCGNAFKSYKTIYDAENMSDRVIRNKASLLLKDEYVVSRLNELRSAEAKKAGVTREDITLMHKEAFEMAKDKGLPAAMTQAAQNSAKLNGLIVDKHEDVSRDRDLSSYTDAELEAIATREDEQTVH